MRLLHALSIASLLLAGAARAEPGSPLGLRAALLPPAPSPNLRLRAAPLEKSKLRLGVKEVYRKVAPATVIVRTEHGYGSGVLVSADGLVLTNHHVASDGASDDFVVSVTLELGQLDEGGVMQRQPRTFRAQVLKWDPARDLAILKIDAPGTTFPFVAISPVNPSPGDTVAALGHGNVGMLWSIRAGQVNAVGKFSEAQSGVVIRPMNESGAPRAASPGEAYMVQTSCTISPGDSGGPLVDTNGRLVGLNVALIRDRGGQPVTANYHVDIREVRAFLKSVPAAPPRIFPDPWAVAGEAREVDLNEDGTNDGWQVTGKGESIVFVAAGKGGVEPRGALEGKPFRTRFALWSDGRTKRCWYDTTGRGEFDLLLVGNAKDQVLAGYQLPSGAPIPAGKRPAKLVDPTLLQGGEQAPEPARPEPPAADGLADDLPDPYAHRGPSELADLDGDGRPDLLAWQDDDRSALVLDAEQRGLGTLEVGRTRAKLGAAQAKGAFALVRAGGQLWAYYDRDGDGAFDLALELGDGFVATRAVAADGAGAFVGQLGLRPGLLRLSAAGRRRLDALLATAKLPAWAIASGESGLAPLPLPYGPAWTLGRKLGDGAVAGIQVAREGASAILMDFDGAFGAAKEAALAAGLKRGTLPASFAFVQIGTMEWVYYDRDGDGAFDLVLFTADASKGRADVAYAVDEDGSLVPVAKLARTPLISERHFANAKTRARAAAFFEELFAAQARDEG
jgi:S1-C subfamily serine protease